MRREQKTLKALENPASMRAHVRAHVHLHSPQALFGGRKKPARIPATVGDGTCPSCNRTTAEAQLSQPTTRRQVHCLSCGAPLPCNALLAMLTKVTEDGTIIKNPDDVEKVGILASLHVNSDPEKALRMAHGIIKRLREWKGPDASISPGLYLIIGRALLATDKPDRHALAMASLKKGHFMLLENFRNNCTTMSQTKSVSMRIDMKENERLQAAVLYAQGEESQAIKHLEELAGSFENLLPIALKNNHPKLATLVQQYEYTLELWGHALYGQEKYEGAINVYQQHRSLLGLAVDGGVSAYIKATHNLARCFVQLDRYADTRRIYMELQERLHKDLKQANPSPHTEQGLAAAEKIISLLSGKGGKRLMPNVLVELITFNLAAFDPAPAAKLCAECGLPSWAICAGCNAVHYCSRECQNIHWYKYHTHVCRRAVPPALNETWWERLIGTTAFEKLKELQDHSKVLDPEKKVAWRVGVLDLSKTDLDDACMVYLGTNVFPALAEKLHTLDLSGTKVTNEGIAAVAGLSSLEKLVLRATNVADEGIAALAGLLSLHTLDLSGTEVEDIAALAGLLSLHTLDLSGTEVEDISALEKLTKMRTLALRNTGVMDLQPLAALKNLHTLDLKNTHVTDAEIAVLVQLTNMHMLDLSGTHVTDAGIAALTRLSRLHTLRLKGTKVTDAGMSAFRTALRNYRSEAGIKLGLKYCL